MKKKGNAFKGIGRRGKSTIQRDKTGGFTQINNCILRDENLKDDEKVVMWAILSQKDSFTFTVEWIISGLKIPRKRAFRISQSLQKYGYLEKIDRGQGVVDWKVIEKPNPIVPETGIIKTKSSPKWVPSEKTTEKSINKGKEAKSDSTQKGYSNKYSNIDYMKTVISKKGIGEMIKELRLEHENKFGRPIPNDRLFLFNLKRQKLITEEKHRKLIKALKEQENKVKA